MFSQKRELPLFSWLFLVPIIFALMSAQAYGAPEASARICVVGIATSDGEVVFEFTPDGGVTQTFKVDNIKKNNKEYQARDKIYRMLRDSLKKNHNVYRKTFKDENGVKRWCVKIKAKRGKPKFTITKKSQTVPGQVYTVEQPNPPEAKKDKPSARRNSSDTLKIDIFHPDDSICNMYNASIFHFGEGITVTDFTVFNESTAVVSIYIEPEAPLGWEEVWVLSVDSMIVTDAGLFTVTTGGIIPTLTEWGLIIFGVVLLGFITWVFLRRRKVVAAEA